MNKFIAILALAAVVAVASANKHLLRGRPHGHHHELDDDFDGEHGNLHGAGHLGHLSDELLLEELRSRGHLHHGLGHGFGLPLRHGLRHPGKRGGPRRGHLVGGGAGIGAGGGLDASEGSFGAIGSATHLGKHGSIEGKKSGLIAGKKGLDVSHSDTDLDNNEGIHKHQVINKDKTIINDRTTGVNDVDAFRKTRLHNDSNRLAAGVSGVAAGEASGRAEAGADVDHKIGAIGGQEAEVGAGAAVGAGLGAGVAEV